MKLLPLKCFLINSAGFVCFLGSADYALLTLSSAFVETGDPQHNPSQRGRKGPHLLTRPALGNACLLLRAVVCYSPNLV